MDGAYHALIARLQRAIDATDVGEVIAVLKESVVLGDSHVASMALKALHTFFAEEPGALLASRCDALLKAGGVPAITSALGEAFRFVSLVFVVGGTLLAGLAKCAIPVHGAREAVAAAARLGLMMQPGEGDWFDTRDFDGIHVTQDSCRATLALLLAVAITYPGVADTALTTEAIDAGAIERLLRGCASGGELTAACVRVLDYFCCVDATCAERIAAFSCLDTVLATIATPNRELDTVSLLCHLLRCPMSPATAERFMSHEAAIFKTLLSALAGPGRRNIRLMSNVCVALCFLATPTWRRAARSRRCEPRLAAAAVDGIVAALRTEGVVATQPTPESPASAAAVNAAIALKAFAGGCGGDDAFAPGTHMLRAGALPLLEAALTHAVAVEEALESSTESSQHSGESCIYESQRAIHIKVLVDDLRGLVARADAAAAELIAEEEASAALSKAKAGKAPSKGKGGKAAKAAKAAKKQPPAPPPVDAAASVDAVPPPPAAAASPAATPAPPELPPWLLDAMQRLPPPSAAAPQPPPSALPPVAAPRQLDTSDGSCAICLDAPAVLRTRCCAKQGPVFCEPCAALLAGVTRCALCGVDAADISGAGTAER
jgi:hypothetical protein